MFKPCDRIAPRLACFAALVAAAPRIHAEELRFDVNDISFLWPAPTSAGDVAKLITADDKLGDGDARVWAAAAFTAVLEKAAATTVVNSGGAENRIEFGAFDDEFKQPKNWKVVAFRVDPSAPGTSPMITKAVGSVPQIRLIMQPVTVADATGEVRVHDVAAHLVFNYIKGFEEPTADRPTQRALADKEAFTAIVEDLKVLKQGLNDGGVSTAGPLSVHPGLKQSTGDFADKVKAFLNKHLREDKLSAVAFMGIEAPEPWIFFAMRQADGAMTLAHQATLGGQAAQMLTFRGGTPVMPQPVPRNLSGGGVSTALLFASDINDKLDKPVTEGADRPRFRDIPEIIANPEITNFANVDCISCHTESARRKELDIAASDDMFRFRRAGGVSGGDEQLLPLTKWNVRNFGWFERRGKIFPTVTARTANEAADSVDFINREYLGLQAP